MKKDRKYNHHLARFNPASQNLYIYLSQLHIIIFAVNNVLSLHKLKEIFKCFLTNIFILLIICNTVGPQIYLDINLLNSFCDFKVISFF